MTMTPEQAPSPATTDEEVQQWVGVELDAGLGDIACEQGYITHWCEAAGDANPLYWDPQVAAELSGGPTAPPTMLSVWMRPLMFNPTRQDQIRPLELHFLLKDATGLDKGIVASNEITFHDPVRPGDRVRTVQSVQSIGPVKTIRLGTGRFWTIAVTYTTEDDRLVGVETYDFFCYDQTGKDREEGS